MYNNRNPNMVDEKWLKQEMKYTVFVVWRSISRLPREQPWWYVGSSRGAAAHRHYPQDWCDSLHCYFTIAPGGAERLVRACQPVHKYETKYEYGAMNMMLRDMLASPPLYVPQLSEHGFYGGVDPRILGSCQPHYRTSKCCYMDALNVAYVTVA